MAKGNSTTLGVNLLVGDAKLIRRPQTLTGESLVDLVNIDIVPRDASKVERLGNGLPGTLTHEERLDAYDGSADVLADDSLAELLGGGASHEENSGGAVGDLAGVAGVNTTVLGESGSDLAEGLDGHVGSDAVVLGDGDLFGLSSLGVLVFHCEGSNLLVEETGLLGLCGLLVG